MLAGKSHISELSTYQTVTLSSKSRICLVVKWWIPSFQQQKYDLFGSFQGRINKKNLKWINMCTELTFTLKGVTKGVTAYLRSCPRILVQVTIYRRLLIGRDGHLPRPIRSLRYIVTFARIRAQVYAMKKTTAVTANKQLLLCVLSWLNCNSWPDVCKVWPHVVKPLVRIPYLI